MNLFGDYDIAGAADNPFEAADGTYRGKILDFDEVSGKKDDGTEYRGTQVTFHPNDGSVNYQHYFSHPAPGDSDFVVGVKTSAMKNFLAGCGVPVSRMNTVTKDDLIGLDVLYKITTGKPNKAGRTFRNIEVRVDSGDFTPSDNSTAASPVEEDDDPFDI